MPDVRDGVRRCAPRKDRFLNVSCRFRFDNKVDMARHVPTAKIFFVLCGAGLPAWTMGMRRPAIYPSGTGALKQAPSLLRVILSEVESLP